MAEKWSKEEVELLKTCAGMKIEDIEKLFPNRTEKAVRGKCVKLKIKIYKKGTWTDEEIELLKTKCNELTVYELESLLNKSPNAIKWKLRDLGLKYLHKSNKTPEKEIFLFLSSNNLQFIRWIDGYQNNTSKIECRCLLHNKNFITSFVSLKFDGVRCDECRIESIRNKKALDEDLVRKHFLKCGYEIISGQYENAYSKLIVRCKNGHLWETDYHNFKHKGRNCILCYQENNYGENSNNWKGGISPVYELLRRSITQWKLDSMQNCNYKCILTGERFEVIHHLYSFNKIVKETFEYTQIPVKININEYSEEELRKLSDICLKIHYQYPLGVCLKSKLHDLFHSLYGILDNTPEQFEEFKQKYLSGEFDLKEASKL